MAKQKKFAHELVASTAKELAGAFYEEAARENDFYAYYPDQKEFIAREWQKFVEMARKQLSIMLGLSTTPENLKEVIFDALLKHASLPGNVDRRAMTKLANNQPTVH